MGLEPSHLGRPPPSDLVMLPAVNEPMILHTLRRRFASDDIYTSIGVRRQHIRLEPDALPLAALGVGG